MYGQSPQMYGTVNDLMASKTKPRGKGRNGGALVIRTDSLWPMICSVALASLVFFAVCTARSVLIRYDSEMLSWAICLVILFSICLIFCGPAINLGGWWRFALLNNVACWMMGMSYGNYLYNAYFKPYADITKLNTYPSVDPETYRGQQLMDAGQIEFVPGSHLDLTKSFGFKNEDTYCVAPIVGPSQNSTQTSANQHYDFWAIGLNCCSGHYADFHCGEFSNPHAQKGLRLMRDDLRGYFRLAVEEATAAYNIQAPHPIFMYWMQFPSDEVDSYHKDGESGYVGGSVLILVVWHAALLLCFILGQACSGTGESGSVTV